MLRIITLICALSLIFAVVFPVADAHIDTPLARHHAPAVHRMIRKRGPAPPTFQGNDAAAGAGSNDPGAVGNVAAEPSPQAPTDATPSGRPTNTPAAGNQAPTETNKPAPAPTLTVTTQTPAQVQTNTQSSSSNGGLLGPVVTGLLGSSSSSSSSSSTVSSTSSTPTSSSSSTSSIASSSSVSSLTPLTSDTPTTLLESETSVPAKVTITSAAAPSSSSAASTSSGSVTKLQRNTIIILIAIGASIGAAGLIWTVIRKWKFRPSSSFEDRMQPIDWQPTTGPVDDHDITEKLSRNGSTRSHGSFTSGNNHDHLTVDMPPHDFTAGPAHLAPVGGYADLQRGPSPQPGIQRGPSFRSPSPYEYEIPNPHGQYYNNAGGYQGGYDHSRGY